MYVNYKETKKTEIATRKQNQNEFDLRTTATGKKKNSAQINFEFCV